MEFLRVFVVRARPHLQKPFPTPTGTKTQTGGWMERKRENSKGDKEIKGKETEA